MRPRQTLSLQQASTTDRLVQHPIGHKYLARVYANFLIYFAFVVPVFLFFRSQRRTFKSRPGLSLLLGWIDGRRPVESTITILLNLLCFGAVLDFLYRGQLLHQSKDFNFSRVGYVDETSARVVIRSPSTAEWSAVQVNLRLAGNPDSNIGSQVVQTSSENDFVGTVTFAGLRPESTYLYTTNASHAGTFTTPQKSPKRWSLISSSCIKPFYPYNPLDSALRVKGLEYLDDFISSNPVDMMLFLGDFIYIDLPIALGWTSDHYTSAYRQIYASNSWSSRLRSLPWIHAYDDHEIINDWSANETGLYQSAMKPFWNYHGSANPISKFGRDETHFIFNRGDVSLFMLDTRRYRSSNAATDGPHKTMLGAEQLRDLEHWLKTEKRWKVVISSVPFTRNWRGPDSADSWSGYLWERDRILDAMRQTQGVVILSGVSTWSISTVSSLLNC